MKNLMNFQKIPMKTLICLRLTTMMSQAEAEQSDLTQREASERQGLGANRANLADAEASEKEMKTYLEQAGMATWKIVTAMTWGWFIDVDYSWCLMLGESKILLVEWILMESENLVGSNQQRRFHPRFSGGYSGNIMGYNGWGGWFLENLCRDV